MAGASYLSGEAVKIPLRIRAGDTTRWVDLPFRGNLGVTITSATHGLTYFLRGPAGQGATVTGEASGEGWAFAFTPSLAPGVYYWQAVSTDEATDETFTAGAGQLAIEPSLAYTGTPDAFDGRSQARKDLEQVEGAIRSLMAGGAVQEYRIGSRNLKRFDLAELLVLRDRLKADVVREERAEKIANGLGDPLKVHVRFRR